MNFFISLLRSCICILLTVPLTAQVEYENFTISNLNIGNALFWTTTSEQNNASFLIEKSTNGQSFTSIIELTGSGDSEELTNYSYIDVKANESRAYYRIKQIAFDGTYSYSKIVEVQQKHPNNLTIERFTDLQDQQSKGFLHVFLSAATAGSLNYTIENKAINLKEDFVQIIEEGSNTLTMDFSNFPLGNYDITMEMGGEIESILIEKITEPLMQAQVPSEGKLIKKY